MLRFPLKSLAMTVTALLAGVAGTARAGTETNIMNNIVSLADSCSLAAIGVDFGVTTLPLPAAGVTASLAASANNGTINAMSGNANHPYFGKDTDMLTLTSPVSAINGVLSTAIGTVSSKLATPGVYVVCTTTPSKITLTGGNGGDVLPLPTATTSSGPPVTFNGVMAGVGGGAGGSNHLKYTLMLAPVVVSTDVPGAPVSVPVSVFTGAYSMIVGTIPADQTGNTLAVGYYWDGATAEVDY